MIAEAVAELVRNMIECERKRIAEAIRTYEWRRCPLCSGCDEHVCEPNWNKLADLIEGKV